MQYRLYVDEVGNDDLGHVSEEMHRYLSLTGVAMHQEHVRTTATPRLVALKQKIFNPDPDDRLILHRTEIVKKKGVFGALCDRGLCEQFDGELESYLRDVDYTVITVIIDKEAMVKKDYWSQNHPYHYLMEILVEKYARWLARRESFGDIMPEKRHGKKDEKLQRAYERVRRDGTSYASSEIISHRIGARALKFRDKQADITGLQLCDLIAHPSHMYVRSLKGHDITLGPYAERVIDILRTQKYDRSQGGQISGYGIKYLP